MEDRGWPSTCTTVGLEVGFVAAGFLVVVVLPPLPFPKLLPVAGVLGGTGPKSGRLGRPSTILSDGTRLMTRACADCSGSVLSPSSSACFSALHCLKLSLGCDGVANGSGRNRIGLGLGGSLRSSDSVSSAVRSTCSKLSVLADS